MSPHEIEAKLRKLNNDYKIFKHQNPSRQAKLPEKIKEAVWRLSDAGVKVSRIASKLGLTRPAIYRWLDMRDLPSVKPGARKSDSISIRINGKRIDVSRKDFRRMILE